VVAPDQLHLAYVISAYKLPGHLVRLVDLLDEPRTTFVVSVDRHTDDATFAQMLDGLGGRRNVHVLTRHSSPYRSFGHVRSTLRGIAHLVEAGIPFDFVSVMTGQDLPIKSNAAIREHLAANEGTGFLEHFPLPTDRWKGGGLNRLNRLFLHTHRRDYSIGRRRFGGLIARTMPFDLAPHGGSGYWTLHRDHVDYVRRYLADNPGYARFFATTDMPDETFFHTILCSSPLADRIVNDDLRLIDWSDPAERPRILRAHDFDELKCAPDLFARKFDPTVDAEVIERVVDELL
jgi:hypothetical protein